METNGSPAPGSGPLQPGKRFAIVMGLFLALCLGAVAVVVAAGRPATCPQASGSPCRVWQPDRYGPDCYRPDCFRPDCRWTGCYRPDCDWPECRWPDCCRTEPPQPVTREQAIEIATRLSAVNGEIVPGATAGYDEKFGRWVWRVSWAYSAGPTSGEFCEVVVDYNTGRILDHACVYA